MQRPSTAHTRRPQTPTHFDAASKLRPNLYSFDIVDWGDARDLSLKNNGFVPKNTVMAKRPKTAQGTTRPKSATGSSTGPLEKVKAASMDILSISGGHPPMSKDSVKAMDSGYLSLTSSSADLMGSGSFDDGVQKRSSRPSSASGRRISISKTQTTSLGSFNLPPTPISAKSSSDTYNTTPLPTFAKHIAPYIPKEDFIDTTPPIPQIPLTAAEEAAAVTSALTQHRQQTQAAGYVQTLEKIYGQSFSYRETDSKRVFQQDLPLHEQEHVNLTSKSLYKCMDLPWTNNVKSLSYHSNYIGAIDFLNGLSCLVQLDFSHNNLEMITGLEYVPNLKVLHLGCNKIAKIGGIKHLAQLEVLSLDNNRIKAIENLDSCKRLTHLNLSQNQIEVIENLQSLSQLTELTLSHNSIHTITKPFGHKPLLKILNLSNNQLPNVQLISDVIMSGSLTELGMAENPLCEQIAPHYRSVIIHQYRNLKVLDGVKITDEERRLSSRAVLKLKANKNKEYEEMMKATHEDEKNHLLDKIHKKWIQHYHSDLDGGSVEKLLGKFDDGFENGENLGSVLPTMVLMKRDNAFAELRGNHLLIAGQNALPTIDKITTNTADIQTLHLCYISLDELAHSPHLTKLISLPSLKKIKLSFNHITSMNQLSFFKKLTNCSIQEIVLASNPILADAVVRKQVRELALFYLSSAGLKGCLERFNGERVSLDDWKKAETKFSGLKALMGKMEQTNDVATDSFRTGKDDVVLELVDKDILGTAMNNLAEQQLLDQVYPQMMHTLVRNCLGRVLADFNGVCEESFNEIVTKYSRKRREK